MIYELDGEKHEITNANEAFDLITISFKSNNDADKWNIYRDIFTRFPEVINTHGKMRVYSNIITPFLHCIYDHIDRSQSCFSKNVKFMDFIISEYSRLGGDLNIMRKKVMVSILLNFTFSVMF